MKHVTFVWTILKPVKFQNGNYNNLMSKHMDFMSF